MEIFESKVRKVGTSFGILIPKENTAKSRLTEGTEVKVAIIKKDLSLVDKMFGSVKARGFQREHTDRAI